MRRQVRKPRSVPVYEVFTADGWNLSDVRWLEEWGIDAWYVAG